MIFTFEVVDFYVADIYYFFWEWFYRYSIFFWRIRYFHYIHENCRMIKCIYNGKRYSIIIVNARFKVALGMHMQLDVVITFKNLRIRPSFRQNNTLKSRLASDQILWIEQSDRVIIRLLTYDTLFYSTLLAKKYFPKFFPIHLSDFSNGTFET